MVNQKITLQNPDVLTVKECFDEYINHCTIKNLSEETIKLYKNQFRVFLETLDDEEKLIDDITSDDVDNFILCLRKNHVCNDITINSYLRGVRAFLYFAMEENYLNHSK